MFRFSSAALRRRLAVLGLCAAAAVPLLAPGAAQAHGWHSGWHGYGGHCCGWHGYGWHGYGWRGYGWQPGIVLGAPVVVAPPPPVVYVPPPVVRVPY
jgi:hypothetical protein